MDRVHLTSNSEGTARVTVRRVGSPGTSPVDVLPASVFLQNSLGTVEPLHKLTPFFLLFTFT